MKWFCTGAQQKLGRTKLGQVHQQSSHIMLTEGVSQKLIQYIAPETGPPLGDAQHCPQLIAQCQSDGSGLPGASLWYTIKWHHVMGGNRSRP